MSISRNNYEAYLVDYLDGKLDAVAVSELLLFLEQHPDLKQEFAAFSSITLEADAVSFDNKASLLKAGYDDVKEEYQSLIVAKLEGELPLAGYAHLKKGFSLYPDLRRDEALFRHTKLSADLSITFKGKDALKKQVIVSRFYNSPLVRIAAVMLFVAFASWMGLRDTGSETTLTALSERAPQNASPKMIVPDAEKPVAAAAALVRKSAGGNRTVIKKEQPSGSIIQHAPEMTSIAGITKDIPVRSELSLPPADLQQTDAVVAYAPRTQAPVVQQPQYPDLKQLALTRIEKQKDQLLGKNDEGRQLTFFQALNKYTGGQVKVDKDTTSGKLNAIEIAGIGFGWGRGH